MRYVAVDALGASGIRNAEARHAAITQAIDLLVEGHEREDIVNALFGSEVGILEGIFVLRRPGRLRVLREK
jgi:hypothetical protein